MNRINILRGFKQAIGYDFSHHLNVNSLIAKFTFIKCTKRRMSSCELATPAI